MNLELTFDATLCGNPCRITVELDVESDGTAYDVIDAHLIHLLPYVPTHPKTLLEWAEGQRQAPDFTACRDLNIRLDPSETDILFSTEIDAAIPQALLEAEQAAADSYRDNEELDFIGNRS